MQLHLDLCIGGSDDEMMLVCMCVCVRVCSCVYVHLDFGIGGSDGNGTDYERTSEDPY